MDRGGLLYPSQALKDLVAAMEDAFTHCFSFNKLKADSIMGLISCLSINKLDMVGCAQHSVEITNQVIRFLSSRGCTSLSQERTHRSKGSEKK